MTLLQCWYEFFNGLIYLSIRMVHAKNYEIASTLNCQSYAEKNAALFFFSDTVYKAIASRPSRWLIASLYTYQGLDVNSRCDIA